MAARTYIGAIALLAACSERSGDFRLELPVTAADHAAIVAVWDPDDATTSSVFAAEIADDGTIEPIAVPFDFGRGVSVAVALYEDSLDTLFIDPGPVGSAGERSIPATGRIFESAVRAGATEPWALAASMPEPLQAARLPALSPCTDFDVARYNLPNFRDPLFAIGVRLEGTPAGFTGRGALIGTQGRQIFYVESSTVVELATTVAGPCGDDVSGVPQFYGAYQEEAGPVWLVARCGEVHKANIDLAGERLVGGPAEAAPHRDTMHTIAGPAAGPVRKLFIASNLGELDEIDLTTSISSLITALQQNGDGGIAYVSGDEAYFAWDASPELYHYRDGVVEAEVLPGMIEDARPLRVAPGGELGFVAGNTAGELFFRRTDRWRPLARALDERIEAITPYDRSVLVLDRGGAVRLFSSERRDFCDPIDAAPASGRARHLAVTGDTAVVAGDSGYYAWLERR